MFLARKLKTQFRGDIPLHHLPLEFVRRRKAAKVGRRERESLDELNACPARLLPEFAEKSAAELLRHYRTRNDPSFWPGVPAVWEADAVIRDADRIANDAAWEVSGFGPIKFAGETAWRCDPLSGHDWGLEHHADTSLYRDDGSDVRVLWEVNRFGHAVTLALAYRATNDERYAETFFAQIESWIAQNPYARGANWGCAMEAALRAANVLAAFDSFRTSDSLTKARLDLLLRFFDQHGRFIVDNSEFSYIATSNHYLSNVVGLFWIGTMMPELKYAHEWRKIGLAEMLREMDKQVLADGVDFEASTGYHRFVTEMLLMSFLLARQNDVEIPSPYWAKLRKMLQFLRDVTRPDGRMPLIGDCDGSRFVPATHADGNETKFLLELGAEYLDDRPIVSTGYPNAGIYILRDQDLFLAFNATGCGLNGRGSHGHNDALSIEVSAFGIPFIVDPGSYAYNLDRGARHEFRSTAFHSTVRVDGLEQNTTAIEMPFVIGDEARPRTIEWSGPEAVEVVAAEHRGYARLSQPVVHRRTVRFDKAQRFWAIEDHMSGGGEHLFEFLLHFAPDVRVYAEETVVAVSGPAKLLVIAPAEFELSQRPGAFSRDYGRREPTTIGVWSTTKPAPFFARFALVPISEHDDASERLELARRLVNNK